MGQVRTALISLEEVICKHRHVRHETLRAPNSPPQLVDLRVQLPELIRREDGDVCARVPHREGVGEIGCPEDEGPHAPGLVVEEGDPVRRRHQGDVAVLFFDDGVVEDLLLEPAGVGDVGLKGWCCLVRVC